MYAKSINTIRFTATWIIETVIEQYSDKIQHIDINKMIIDNYDMLHRMEEGRSTYNIPTKQSII